MTWNDPGAGITIVAAVAGSPSPQSIVAVKSPGTRVGAAGNDATGPNEPTRWIAENATGLSATWPSLAVNVAAARTEALAMYCFWVVVPSAAVDEVMPPSSARVTET